MKQPCLAIHQRAAPGSSRASKFGAANGCIYCRARDDNDLLVGDQVVILNGFDTGAMLEVETGVGEEVVGRWIWPEPQMPNARRRLRLPFELLAKNPIPFPPTWFPPLSMRDTFIIDELATWLCNRGIETGNFVWYDEDIDEVVSVLWEKRLPIEPSEMVRYCAAHGMPTELHSIFGARLEHGLRLLRWAKGRRPVQMKRLKSFENYEITVRQMIEDME